VTSGSYEDAYIM